MAARRVWAPKVAPATVADGTASAPLAISTPGQVVYLPQVGAAPDGTVQALWYAFEAGAFHFYEATVAHGLASAPVDTGIVVHRTAGFLFPELEVGSDGTLYLAYEDIEVGSAYPDSPDIFFTRRNAGSPGFWSASVNATKTVDNLAHSSDAALFVDPAGTVHLAWVEQDVADPVNFELWHRADEGSGFGDAADLSMEGLTNNILTPERSQIIADCDGRPRIGWQSRPPELDADEAELHVSAWPGSGWQALARGRRGHDIGWRIDELGEQHLLWVEPGATSAEDQLRYLHLALP